MAEQPFLPFDEVSAAPTPEPPPPAGSPLIASLALACERAPLAEKVLIAPSLFVGHALAERLAREGHAWSNLRVDTVRTIALQLVGPDLARDGLRLLSRAQALALVEQACGEFLRPGGYFAALRDRPGFHRALQRTFEELRGAAIPAADLPEEAFTDPRKREELRGILARYEAALAASRWVDRAEVLRRALEAAAAGRRLPGERLFLAPRGVELSAVERALLERLADGRLETLETETPDAWTAAAARAALFRATGEENEIREVFRRVLASGTAFDEVEIVSTDPRLYSALCWELAREHGVPCTFSAGIAVTFTKPGQAALAFLDWIAAGFAAESLRRALSSATLTLSRLGSGPGSSDAPGARAAGRALREARVGWGMARHRTALDRLVAELERPEEGGREDDDAGEDERRERARRRQRRLAAARAARDFVRRSLELAECAGGSERESCDLRALARATRTFMTEFARIADALDGAALAGLQKLLEELELLSPAALAPSEAAERLADAVRGLSVESDRARPGRVHVTDVSAGGFSGRRHAFLLGLDEGRHPGADLEDPVLLDAERRAINRALAPAALPLFRDRPREASRALGACMARFGGNVTVSYSSWKLRSLDQQSEQFPSPFFLAVYREASGNARADYTDLAAALPEVAGFAPAALGTAALDESEWWLAQLTRARGTTGGAAADAVAALHPHLEDGRRAEEARASDAFTVYDGWVRGGTPELDPRLGGDPQSASRLQLLAACPFRYFVRYVLGVEIPETTERDRLRWLDPLAAGQLLHDVFRLFFETITARGEKPGVERHTALIEEIADGQIRVWTERIPPRSELSFGQRREELLFACRAFLRLEEEHCREVTPRFFEVPFGMPRADLRASIASREPVAIDAGGGRSFLLRGKIDRVDEGADGAFEVWDYKTGTAFGFSEARGLQGGRRIQYALYALALETLLGRAGLTPRVSQSGYFFPGRRGEGQRFRMPLDREKARETLNRLMDLLAAGAFPHAVDPGDCSFCDYESVCGGAGPASARSRCKLEASNLRELRAFREMHEEE
ncbi:MAG TPA: PD-(D/E)XK nuclease family protein [Thermoanaerobaculia bacterium]